MELTVLLGDSYVLCLDTSIISILAPTGGRVNPAVAGAAEAGHRPMWSSRCLWINVLSAFMNCNKTTPGFPSNP
jgi:hypothetical protein